MEGEGEGGKIEKLMRTRRLAVRSGTSAVALIQKKKRKTRQHVVELPYQRCVLLLVLTPELVAHYLDSVWFPLTKTN